MNVGDSLDLNARGAFCIACHDSSGELKWQDFLPNQVMIAGANLMLNTAFNPSTNGTIAYMGLITNNAFNVISANDSMSIKGWTESNCYIGARPTITWAPAASGHKAFSAPAAFVVQSADDLVGGFIVFGTGATNLIFSTTGTLWSATGFTNNNHSVLGGDNVSISYTTSLLG